METVLTNARVVTSDEEFNGTVVLKGGLIASIEQGQSQVSGAKDLDGNYLIPGLVDLHTDALEKQMMPRPNVSWNPIAATIAHDALTTTSAITTVFESLAAGASVAHPERNETLKPMIDGLHETQGKGLLRGEHLVHLRCCAASVWSPASSIASAILCPVHFLFKTIALSEFALSTSPFLRRDWYTLRAG